MVLLLLHYATTQQSTTKYNENIQILNSTNTTNYTLSQSSSQNDKSNTTQILINENSATTSFLNLLNSTIVQNNNSPSTKFNFPSTTAIPSVFQSKSPKLFNKIDSKKLSQRTIEISHDDDTSEWKCPNISQSRNLECGCDMPHTLRCSGDIHSLEVIVNLTIFYYLVMIK